MIAVHGFKGKSVGVFGLARSGLSSVRALQAGGARVLAWDDKPEARKEAESLGAQVQPWEPWPWGDLAALVLSPGVPLTYPKPHAVALNARGAGVPVIGDIELFARTVQTGTPLIAVTGTNGKSTTTALIGHILQSAGYDAQVGGNIGRPALDLVPPNAKTAYVLEVSSYQIELAPGLEPSVAVLTNLASDHIDRHGSMEAYAAVKAALLERTKRSGHVVVGVDDAHSAAICTRLLASAPPDVFAVSVGKVLNRGVFVVEGRLYDGLAGTPVQVGDLTRAARLPGAHNWQNAALAYAAVRGLAREPHTIMGAIERFAGLPHRTEEAGRIGKVRFINDSKATNADAAGRALACFNDIYWIAGGRPKQGGIAGLTSYFHRIRKAYLIGEAAADFAATLSGRVEHVVCGTLDRALNAALADARAGSAADPVVLLSPACASFDQFRDYEQRGDVFRAAVKAMMECEGNLARAHA
ncbi:MAG: UDP-N-acetylmuramoyl-L-alanine--D-glutamate ligase [Alphaproteobacteria bacterium]